MGTLSVDVLKQQLKCLIKFFSRCHFFNSVTPAIPNDFFPLTVSWTSDTSLCLLAARGVSQAEGGAPVPFSHEVSLLADKYEIV